MPYEIVTPLLSLPCAKKTAEMLEYSAAIPIMALSMMAAFAAVGAGTTKAWVENSVRMF